MNKDEIKAAVPMRRLLDHFGVPWKGTNCQCLMGINHKNGDTNFSASEKYDRLFCFGCDAFGENGADIFSVVGIKEKISSFPELKEWFQETFNLHGHATSKPVEHRTILRRYKWTDAQEHEAWHLRWSNGAKFSWAQDPDGQQPRRGACRPSLYQLD
ncbi:MAG: hypothetical protein IH978_09825, partial [Nitrospinae bacterium]|nr:hypothetical protein [Nitrospinota bacterium]